MICENCEERQATLHFTNYVNGKKSERHLCQQCARENGYLDTEEEAYTIHDLISGLFNVNSNLVQKAETAKRNEKELACPKCKMTHQQFTKTGKFGCSECYQTFSDYLTPILRRVHGGNTKHSGKIPKRQHDHLEHRRLIQDYRDKLQELIKAEEFEEAAVLRDKIRELEKKGESSQEKGDDI